MKRYNSGNIVLVVLIVGAIGFLVYQLVKPLIKSIINVIPSQTTAPTEKLSVVGNICATGTITASQAGCGSDIRWKKNIEPIKNSLNNILLLKGIYYDWKTEEFPEKQFSTNRQLGFIAQEMQKVYPELIITDKQGYLSVDYQRFTVILLEAIKEQQKIIDKLQSAVGSLQTENQNLKAEYDNRLKKIEELLGNKSEK